MELEVEIAEVEGEVREETEVCELVRLIWDRQGLNQL